MDVTPQSRNNVNKMIMFLLVTFTVQSDLRMTLTFNDGNEL